jgi:hypothetical protein
MEALAGSANLVLVWPARAAGSAIPGREKMRVGESARAKRDAHRIRLQAAIVINNNEGTTGRATSGPAEFHYIGIVQIVIICEC